MRKRNKNSEYVECAICSRRSTRVYLSSVTSWEHEGVFTIVECNHCTLKYVNPRPVRTQMHQYYPTASYWGDNITISQHRKDWNLERQKNYNLLYSRILARKKTGSILDIGAGTGLFLSNFKDRGWNVQGVEFVRDAAVFAQKVFGIKLLVGDFLDYSFKKNIYDVVTLNNVLEHVFEPKKTLKQIHKVLKPDGLVVITVPNNNSIGARIFKNSWYPLQPPRHLYHFTPETLRLLLAETGFAVQAIDYGFRIHNYAAIFESMRLLLSPRFKKKQTGGLVSQTHQPRRSLKKDLGKISCHGIAMILCFIEPVIRKGETMTVIAVKA